MSDLRSELVAAAGNDAGSPDLDSAWRRGRLLRHQRTRRVFLAATLCIGLVVAGVIIIVDASDSRVSVAPASGARFTDPVQHFSVSIPTGWRRSDRVLVQNPGPSEYELLAAGTYRVPEHDAGSSCGSQLPNSAVGALGPRDAFVYVIEGLSVDAPGGVESHAPSEFRDRPVRFKAAPFLTGGCTEPTRVARPHDMFRHMYFNDHDRVIGVFIAWGTRVTAKRRAETWRLLDSLQFESLGPEPRPRTIRDDFNGFSVTVPSDWLEYTSSPFTLLDLVSPERVDLGCGVSTNSASLSVGELVGNSGPGITAAVTPGSQTFGPDSGSLQSQGASTANGCAVSEPPAQVIFFSDAGRRFQIFLRFYPEATAERRQQAYAILNSMQFEPDSQLHRGRPRNEVRVFLLNGSGHPGAIAAAQSQLTVAGYVVVGSRRAGSNIQTTTATCLRPYRDDIEFLARFLGADTRTEPSPQRAPARTKHADCIVTLGRSAGFSTEGGNAPQMVRVAVLNGSSKPQGASLIANELRGLGYELVAVANTANRDGTIVACRRAFASEAQPLSTIVKSSTIEKFPDPAPPEARDADCIVLLGN